MYLCYHEREGKLVIPLLFFFTFFRSLTEIMVFGSEIQGFSAESDDLDNILASIKGLDITPEKIREFLPKVNWDKLASMYLRGRSGAECEARYVLDFFFFVQQYFR